MIELAVDYNRLRYGLPVVGRVLPAGRIYNVHFQPPRVDGLCDVDGTTLIIRDDDREEVIRERLTVYESQTKPVVDYYREQGRLAW